MYKVDDMIKHVEDEVIGATHYAEDYVMYKNSKPVYAKMYAEMSSQEMEHANNLSEIYKSSLDEMAFVPEEDKEKWDCCQKKLAEKEATIKYMLSK